MGYRLMIIGHNKKGIAAPTAPTGARKLWGALSANQISSSKI
jgi:hypothetical protein